MLQGKSGQSRRELGAWRTTVPQAAIEGHVGTSEGGSDCQPGARCWEDRGGAEEVGRQGSLSLSLKSCVLEM